MTSVPVFGEIARIPETIAGLKLVDVRHYQQPSLGMTMKYGFPPILFADAYLYNNGIPNIPDDLRSPVISDSFRQQHQGILMMETVGALRDVEVLQSSILAHPFDRNVPLCYWSTFAYRHVERRMSYRDMGIDKDGDGVMSDHGRLISHLTLRGDRGHFNKVRFTYIENMSDPAYLGLKARERSDPGLEFFLRFVSDWILAVQQAPKSR